VSWNLGYLTVKTVYGLEEQEKRSEPGKVVETDSGNGVVELLSAGVDETDFEQENFRYIL
jgi:hypothetical protein